MQDYITLKVKVRSFPSQGRARVHESVFSELQLKEGESLLLLKYPATFDDKEKPVSVAAFGDSMVGKGIIMLSPEDMAAISVAEGDTVSVKRKVPLTETLAKKAGKTGEAVKEGAGKAGSAVKSGAGKAGETIGKGAKDISEKVKPKKGDKEL